MGNIVYRDYTRASEYCVSEVSDDSKREDRIYRISADADGSFGVSISGPDGEMLIPTRDLPLFIKMLQEFVKDAPQNTRG